MAGLGKIQNWLAKEGYGVRQQIVPAAAIRGVGIEKYPSINGKTKG